MSSVSLSPRSAVLLLANWRQGTDQPAYEALADSVRMLVIDGRIPVGARLPAERALAESLALSRTTVANAYSRLRQDGYLWSLRGSGSVVRLPREVGGRPDPEHLGGPVDDNMLDLRRAVLHAAPGVAEAAERALRSLPAALSQMGYDTVGDPLLRSAIADRYAERGLPTTPDQIMVTLGAQHAIALLARVLVRRGDPVLIESPTYPHAHEALREAGGRLVAVPVDAAAGWDEAAIETAFRRTAPAMAYVMPDLHNPTGATMPRSLRRSFLRTAASFDTVVVADETMGELRIDGDVMPPMAVDGPAVLIGSAGKAFWGALRIGWIRADPALLQRLALARPTHDLGSPVLDQLVVRELVPRTAAVLEARREFLRKGRDEVVAALRARLPQWRVPSPDGGLTTWVALGRPVSNQLALALRAEGVAIAGGGVFGPDGGFDRFLRVPFCGMPADRERMLDAFVSAWNRVGGLAAIPPGSSAAVV